MYVSVFVEGKSMAKKRVAVCPYEVQKDESESREQVSELLQEPKKLLSG